MDTMLDMTKKSVFCLFPFITDRCCMGKYFFLLFMPGNFIDICFGEMAPVVAMMGAISLLFSTMDNALLHASGNPPVDKIEDRITFALRHARLYLFESYDERDDKSSAANTFDIFCGGGRSRSSL